MPSGSGFLTGPEAQGKKHSLFYEKRECLLQEKFVRVFKELAWDKNCFLWKNKKFFPEPGEQRAGSRNPRSQMRGHPTPYVGMQLT